MAEPAKKLVSDVAQSSNTTRDISKEIQGRRSNELIIGLCGAIGSGVKTLKHNLISSLKASGYEIVDIRLSSFIIDHFKSKEIGLENLKGFDRYNKYQDLGDELRELFTCSILAEHSIAKIKKTRYEIYEKQKIKQPEGKVTINAHKVAYLIDQVKHPDEVKLLKEVYGRNFYLIGLLRNSEQRKKNLSDEQISLQNIATLMERDRKDKGRFGQQVEKTLQKSDYFIKNIDDKSCFKSSVERFVKLVHGIDNLTPTTLETGMYYAYSASVRSACLSRQVGAAICDDNGVVLSTGCNDVPKFGGGLYQSEDIHDMRCFNKGGQCQNDFHKSILKDQIVETLRNSNVGNPEKIAASIMTDTKAQSIIEYSRAVHAEMDAIVSLARSLRDTSVGKTLYCTTYPCHVCTRHIIAAGIKKVVYIEPYEKSLANDLYDDSLTTDELSTTKVVFDNFEGTAPSRYTYFFRYRNARKDTTGKLIEHSYSTVNHSDPQYLDGYGDYEVKVTANLQEILSEKGLLIEGN